MSALGVHGMECSLIGWPSISQFDDFFWTGLRERDPFGSLQQPNGSDYDDSKSSSSASGSMESEQYLQQLDTVDGTNIQKLSPVCPELSEMTQAPNMLQADALLTWRWDSINATDLASVLDSTFPSQTVSSITREEGEYTLYGDELLMQPETILNGELDIFTADAICDNTNMMTARDSDDGVLADVSIAGRDCVSLLSSQVQATLTDCNWDTVGDMNTTDQSIESSTLQETRDHSMNQAIVQPSLPPVLDCKLQSLGASQLSISNSDGCEAKMEVLSSNHASLPAGRGSRDAGGSYHCSSCDNENELSASQHCCTRPDMLQQQQLSQPVTNVVKSLDQGKNLCLRTIKVEEGDISIASPHRKAVVSSRLSSQKKINRAQQASRARRLASCRRHAEGRAKKCALRKLMHRSPVSTNRTCDRLSQNYATLMPMLHTSGHMVSQSIVGVPGVQSLQINETKQQKPMLLPVVVPAPPRKPIQVQNTSPFVGSTSVQVDPNLTHELQLVRSQCEVPTEPHGRSSMDVLQEVQVNSIQRSPVTSLTHGNQDQCFSSESSVVQLPSAERLIQSLPNAPGTGFQSTVSNLRPVKGNEFALATESLEATMLKQLENVVRKLNGQTRLCVRDSLYRLARSAKVRQNEAESSSTSNFKSAVETETNSTDRWIANLLFCKPLAVSKSQVFPPKFLDATCQSYFHFVNANGNTQHWNDCVNP